MKRFLSFLMALVLLLCAVGCGEKEAELTIIETVPAE
jgi:hypothetical protein